MHFQVYDDKKLATHYMRSRKFLFDLTALIPLDLLQIKLGTQPLLRFPRFCKVSICCPSHFHSLWNRMTDGIVVV